MFKARVLPLQVEIQTYVLRVFAFLCSATMAMSASKKKLDA